MKIEAQFFKPKRFLIVDDFEPIRASVRGMLQALGAEDIHTAANGQRALDLCEVLPFDCIVCDFNLGEGKDGYQLFEELKIRKLMPPDAVFIMISAETKPQEVQGLVELQPDDYLLKPFTYKILERRLLRAFYKKRHTREIYRQLEAGHSELALNECDRIQASIPSLRLITTRLKGETLVRRGEFVQAAELYQKALKERGYGWAALGLAICWVNLERWQPVRRLLLELVARDDTRLEAYDWLTIVSLRLGQPEEARDFLQKSIRISPRNIKRQQAMAQVAQILGEYDTAESALQQVVRLARFSVYDSHSHHLALARCLLDRFDQEASMSDKLLARAQSIIADAQRRYGAASLGVAKEVLLARIEVAKGKLQAAKQRLDELQAACPLLDDADLQLDLAKASFAMGDQQQARQLLMRLVEKSPAPLELQSQARGSLLQQQVVSQMQLAERLLELNERGLELYRNNLFEAASDTFMEAHKVMPTHPMVALNLLQSLAKEKVHQLPFEQLKATCQRCLRILDAARLDESQLQRYQWIKPEIDKLMVRSLEL